MTTRKPLLSDEEIKRYTITGSWENNGLYHCEEDSLGGWVRFADHLADRTALLAEIERVEAMVPRGVQEMSDEWYALRDKGWRSVFVNNDSHVGVQRLMVPPIPLPETKGDAG